MSKKLADFLNQKNKPYFLWYLIIALAIVGFSLSSAKAFFILLDGYQTENPGNVYQGVSYGTWSYGKR